MTSPIECGVIVEGEESNAELTQGGQTRHVPILMPVADSTIVDHMTTFEDGVATDDLPGPSAVAVAWGRASIDAVVDMEPANAGDTTEVTDEEVAANFDTSTQLPHLASALDNHPPVEAFMPADHDDMTGVVDLGWGVVLPKLSVQDFKEILSFPKL